RREQEQVRIRSSRLAQHGENVFAIVINRETLQIRIGLAFIEAVHIARIITSPDAGATDVESHFRRAEHLVKKFFTGRWIETVKGETGCIGKRSAKAVNRLVLLIGIKNDGGSAGCTSVLP